MTKKPFTQIQKVGIIGTLLAVVLAIVAWSAFGETIVGITLRSNDALQNGLVAHYTFDGPDVTNVADVAGWYDTNYAYRRKVTIQSSKVGTTTSSFAIAATTTQNSFKHESLGGGVKTNDGRDIILVNSSGSALLDYYQEDYSSSTGAITYWVRADVSSTADKDFYVYYGYTGASDLSNKTGVWTNSSAHVVYDLSEDPSITNCSTYEVCDASGNSRHGDAVAAFASGDSVPGRIGQAIQFNGTTHEIDSVSFDIGAVNHLSMSYWAKYDSASPAWSNTINKNTQIMAMYVDSNNKYHSFMGNGGSYHTSVTITPAYSDYNQWHLYTGVYDGSYMRLYRDGTEVGSTTETGNFTSSSQPLVLGEDFDTREFDGALDDVRFYDNALTAGDITTIYNNTFDNSSFLSWAAEEPQSKSWTVANGAGGASATLYRASSSTDPAFVPGAVGQGLSFNGSTDYASSTGSLGSIQTVGFWVQLATTTLSQKMVNLSSSARIETDGSGNVVCTGCTGATIYVDGSSASANIPRTGEWHHVVVTMSSVTANNFQMGRANGVYLGGSLDDVRAYDRQLSAAEIPRLYGLGATTRVGVSQEGGNTNGLLAWWTFDGKDIIGVGATEPWYDQSYGYRKRITLVSSFMATTSSAYQFVATTTSADLKYTGHGGNVASTVGTDIIFVNSTNDAIIPYYQEYYSSSTGEIVYWFRSPVSSSADQTVYMYYGKAGASDLSDKTGVWSGSSAYVVYDLSENPSQNNCSTYQVCDASGNGYNGSTTPTFSSSNSVTGQLGKGIHFNGSTEYIESISFNVGTIDHLSMSYWAKYDNASPGWNITVDKKNTVMNMAPTTDHKFYAWLSAGGTWHEGPRVSTAYTDWNVWHHYVGVYNGSKMRIYRDGVEVASSTESGNLLSSNNPLQLGTAVSGRQFLGSLDDVRLYDDALTQEDITTMYNNTSNNSSFLQWGAETALADINSASFVDRSGHGNTATSTSVTHAPGPIGQAASFNGVYTSVQANALGSGLQTIAFWVRFSTTTLSQPLVQLNSTDRIETNGSGNVVCTNCGTTTIYINGSSASANIPRTGEWYHVSVTSSGGLTGSTFHLGYAPSGSRYLGGSLDDVRIYSRVLTQDEITRIYGLGATTRVGVTLQSTAVTDTSLVGWWKFDGPTINWASSTAEVLDSSGSAVNGDAQGSLGTLSAARGVIGQGLSFNGSNDLIDFGNKTAHSVTGDVTIGAWIKPNASSSDTFGAVIRKGIDTDELYGLLYAPADQRIGFQWYDGSLFPTVSSPIGSVPAGSWTHVVGRRSGTTIEVYINGVLATQSNTGTTPVGASPVLRIGNAINQHFSGEIDDVRIYNRALSSLEIKQLYQLGS